MHGVGSEGGGRCLGRLPEEWGSLGGHFRGLGVGAQQGGTWPVSQAGTQVYVTGTGARHSHMEGPRAPQTQNPGQNRTLLLGLRHGPSDLPRCRTGAVGSSRQTSWPGPTTLPPH